LKLPDLTLPDGSILTDRELVMQVYEKRGMKNVKGKQVETVEHVQYGYVVSTRIAPGAGADTVQRSTTARR